jgi:DNA polymerase IIIc chi subunit
MKKAIDDRKIEKLKQNLHLVDHKSVNNHTIFVESEEEAIKKTNDINITEENKNNDDENKKLINELTNNNQIINKKTIKKIVNSNLQSYEELEKRQKRADKLKEAFFSLTQQRNLSKKNAKKIPLIQNNNNNDNNGDSGDEKEKFIYKWKRQRVR